MGRGCKACDRRCKQCVGGGISSDHGSDKYGRLTASANTTVQDIVRNDALARTRTELESKVTSWIDRVSLDRSTEHVETASDIKRVQKELRNLKILQKELREGPPSYYNGTGGTWYPRCHMHGAKLKSYEALMNHFGRQDLHGTLCDLCSDDWSDDVGYDCWGMVHDEQNEQDDNGSWDDEDTISLPVPADTLPA